MSNTARSNQDFEPEWVDAVLSEVRKPKEDQEVTITQTELKEIFQKLNLSGKQILNIDKEVFEKLEAYMKQVDKLNEYKRRIARQELQKYLVPACKIKDEDDNLSNITLKTYVNKKGRGKFKFYSYNNDSDNYNILEFRDFKYIVAGTEYSYLFDAFSQTGEDSEEEQYIDVYLWALDKGGYAEIYTGWSEEKSCRIRIPKK